MPELTCILVSPLGWGKEIEGSLEALRAQTMAHRMEVLLLGPGPTVGPMPSASGFHSLRWLPVAPGSLRGHSAAQGIRQASAAWVGLIENHAFPDPDWAEKLLLEARSRSLAGVCGRYRGANPATLPARVSEKIFHWAFSAAEPRSTGLPWHNVIFRRDLLLQLGEALPTLLEPEQHLQQVLLGEGHQFGYVASAGIAHLHTSSWWFTLLTVWHFGRVEAQFRARNWPGWRRQLYALVWPLLMMRKTWHLRSRLRECCEGERWWRVFPAMLLIVHVMALAEAAGFLWGANDFYATRMELELELRLNAQELEDYQRSCKSL